MASHDLTLKNYQKQLKDNIRFIYDNYADILKTKTEHVNFEVQVKSAEIVRSFQSLMQLVSEIRTFLIINDLVAVNNSQQNAPTNQQQLQRHQLQGPSSQTTGNLQQQQQPLQTPLNTDEKLIKLRDDISMFLYELEIPLAN